MSARELFFEEAKKCGFKSEKKINKLYELAERVFDPRQNSKDKGIKLSTNDALKANMVYVRFGMSLSLDYTTDQDEELHYYQLKMIYCK